MYICIIFHLCIVARTGFEEPLYSINETGGSQEICVQVFNPPKDLQLTIEIILIASTTTVNSSAGITITCVRYIQNLSCELQI